MKGGRIKHGAYAVLLKYGERQCTIYRSLEVFRALMDLDGLAGEWMKLLRW
jgi:hypothetical protein